MLENFNDKEIKPLGTCLKMKNEYLKQSLFQMTSPDVGTDEGDKLLAEGRSDPAVEMELLKSELA